MEKKSVVPLQTSTSGSDGHNSSDQYHPPIRILVERFGSSWKGTEGAKGSRHSKDANAWQRTLSTYLLVESIGSLVGQDRQATMDACELFYRTYKKSGVTSFASFAEDYVAGCHFTDVLSFWVIALTCFMLYNFVFRLYVASRHASSAFATKSSCSKIGSKAIKSNHLSPS